MLNVTKEFKGFPKVFHIPFFVFGYTMVRDRFYLQIVFFTHINQKIEFLFVLSIWSIWMLINLILMLIKYMVDVIFEKTK